MDKDDREYLTLLRDIHKILMKSPVENQNIIPKVEGQIENFLKRKCGHPIINEIW